MSETTHDAASQSSKPEGSNSLISLNAAHHQIGDTFTLAVPSTSVGEADMSTDRDPGDEQPTIEQEYVRAYNRLTNFIAQQLADGMTKFPRFSTQAVRDYFFSLALPVPLISVEIEFDKDTGLMTIHGVLG